MYPKLKTFGGITHFQKLLSKGLRESQKEKCRNTVKALEVFFLWFGFVSFLAVCTSDKSRALSRFRDLLRAVQDACRCYQRTALLSKQRCQEGPGACVFLLGNGSQGWTAGVRGGGKM